MTLNYFLRTLLPGFLAVALTGIFSPACQPDRAILTENNFDTLTWNPYIEKDFPFMSTYLDARSLGPGFPEDNVVARGLVINLDDSAFVCFDRDLLRWSVAWTGAHLTESTLPQVSYSDFFNKWNHVPRIAGKPAIANGIYPGGSSEQVVVQDIRPETQHREGFTWGPLPETYGRWQGAYVYNNRIVMSYQISGTDIVEMPGVIRRDGEVFFTRTLEVGSATDTLFLQLANVPDGREGITEEKMAYVYTGTEKDTIIAASVSSDVASVLLTENRYLSVKIPPSHDKRQFTVLLWRGTHENIGRLARAGKSVKTEIPAFRKGSDTRWPEKVLTRGQISPDTAAFVTDLLTLPVPNPWKRNVRVTDMAFLNKKKAVVTTFEGDVWLVDGIDDKLKKLTWRRFASGLYEPMSVEVYKDQIYVFGKEGILRLHDLNNDGEADYYENFSDVMQQSAESYEWAADMVFSEKNNGIIIAKGGGVTARPGITKTMIAGFRAGSNHSGVIMKISMDGRKGEIISTGFRAPYLGVHPESGVITATDQQGNYVATTPIYVVEKGDFFGVPATSHRTDDPEPKRPLTWIPHRVDRSAASEIWMTSKKMGPLNEALVHFSFGKPGLFRVLIDSTAEGLQGGVTSIHSTYSTPVLKGVIGSDGYLYMAGFNLFGSSSKGISAIQRMRYTGLSHKMPVGLKIGKQGIIIRFDSPLDQGQAADLSNYRIKRWNYQRTEHYGSGHFKLDETPGEEILPVLGAYPSADRKSVLLLIPDMQPVDQMEVLYTLATEDGKPLDDGIWLSVNHVPDLGISENIFANVDLDKLKLSKEQMDTMIQSDPPITRDHGRQLFVNMGCAGCHSPGTETAGMYGPPFKGLYESERELTDGTKIIADDAYLRESILRPEVKTVKGYESEMPSFEGILSEPDIEALLLYIMYLKY